MKNALIIEIKNNLRHLCPKKKVRQMLDIQPVAYKVSIDRKFTMEVCGFKHTSPNAGEGNKTIFVLPGLDDSVSYYQAMLGLLAEHNPSWNVIAVDLRGQGLTLHKERKIAQMKIKIEEQTQIVNEIFKQERISECFVIGLSYAGAVTLQLARENKSIIKGIGLIAPYVTNFKSYKRGVTGLYYTLLDKHPAKGLISMMSLPFYFQMAKYEHRLNLNKNWTSREMNALTKLTLGVLEYNTEEAVEDLGELSLGIHILCGFDDQVIPISAHKNFYHNIPNHLHKTFSLEEGVGHRIFERHPAIAADWVHRVLHSA